MRHLLLCVVLLSGCAPLDIYKGGCGNAISTKNTVPYTFGNLDAGANGCYLIHYGKSPSDYTAIKTLMTTYMTTAKPNTIVTSDGTTIIAVPPTVTK